MTGPQIIRALEAGRRFRSRYPDVPIVWGGIHASLLPEQTLENPYVDMVVIGEGEATLLELVKALESGSPLDRVRGIAYRKNGRYRTTPARPFVDLDAQPPLAYELIDMDLYRRRIFGSDHVSFNSSRGCVFGCAFCWDPVMHKRKWRAMEAETVIEHLKRIIKDYGIRSFLFSDDNFFVDMDRAYRILEGVIQSGLDISIGKLQIRVDALCSMNKDFLQLLVKAGVKRIHMGVESGSQRVLDLIAKKQTVEQVVEANRKLRPYPIVPLYLFMMGIVTETPAEFAKSIRLATLLTSENPKAVKTFNIYTPYPGTELYNLARRKGLREPDQLEDWSGFNYRSVPEECGWINREMRKLITGLDFPLMFLGKGHFVSPYKKMNPLVVALSRLYYPFARYRVNHLDVRLPIETYLVKNLGLFGRQD
jgi:radical SAM superfamily enzyme YgiQ (UPF0313 family)